MNVSRTINERAERDAPNNQTKQSNRRNCLDLKTCLLFAVIHDGGTTSKRRAPTKCEYEDDSIGDRPKRIFGVSRIMVIQRRIEAMQQDKQAVLRTDIFKTAVIRGVQIFVSDQVRSQICFTRYAPVTAAAFDPRT
jgi:hypothetical protein